MIFPQVTTDWGEEVDPIAGEYFNPTDFLISCTGFIF